MCSIKINNFPANAEIRTRFCKTKYELIYSFTAYFKYLESFFKIINSRNEKGVNMSRRDRLIHPSHYSVKQWVCSINGGYFTQLHFCALIIN